MSTTSLADLTSIFNSILWSFYYVILPICFIFGNIGNCLNLIIFSQRSSRTNSCLLYFLSASIINIFILNFGLVLRILRGIWNIDPAVQFVWFCRLRTYLINVLFLSYRCSILFACIDRMCASSRSAWLRLESQSKVAYRLIGISWILCIIYFIPTLIYPVIIYGQCLLLPDNPYATYLTISALILGLLIPLLMIICGILTVRHVKTAQTRVVPGNSTVSNEHRATNQYLVMLLVQVVADALANIVYPIYLVYNLVYPPPQSAQTTAISTFLINLSFNVPYLNYSAGFYLHTLSSPTFRRKLIRLLTQISCLQSCIYRKQHKTLDIQ